MAESEVFSGLSADEAEVTEMESLCLNCRGNGTTRLLLTRIPFYREVVIMSFRCEHCGWHNSELQPAACIQPTGVRYTLTVSFAQDLNRQVVRSDSATVTVPELEFEIPAKTQEGSVTTVEGLLQRAVRGLERSLEDAQPGPLRDKLADFVARLRQLQALERPFRLILDDPSGNSFVENPSAPSSDPSLSVVHYPRTKDQDRWLGVLAPEEDKKKEEEEEEDVHRDVLRFPTDCSECGAPCETRMKLTQVPHFKEVVIMATVCERCGHRTSEVKGGAGIEPLGVRLELRVSGPADLARDVLKSETCSLRVPELDLDAGQGVVAGRFTTVEGLLEEMRAQLSRENPFFQGDSAPEGRRLRMGTVVDRLGRAARGELPVTLVLDDPCGNSHVQSLCAPDPDPALTVVRYQRSFEQDEALGLNDIRTEGYQQDP
uniref:Putative c4-type zn-finger protein n=1 Tax=Ixodes ricinus TaxID=34613 RepID=A0A131Y240_IXORI